MTQMMLRFLQNMACMSASCTKMFFISLTFWEETFKGKTVHEIVYHNLMSQVQNMETRI